MNAALMDLSTEDGKMGRSDWLMLIQKFMKEVVNLVMRPEQSTPKGPHDVFFSHGRGVQQHVSV